MMRSLWSAASGMKTQQQNMDVIAHNLANVNTTGAKKQRAEFQDLIYQNIRQAGADSGDGTTYPTAMQIGLGARLAATNRIFSQGNIQTTDNNTDIAIQGEGFFRITMPDGSTAYTRDGSFKLDSNGNLVTSDGYMLADNITIDTNAPNDSIVISSDGYVSYTVAGENTSTQAGQITLARFVNPAGLTAVGKNLFVQSGASGEPIENAPGTDGSGTLIQSTLEMSNVQIVDEMVNLIVSQRAYESNSKAVTTSDSMLETANGLKR